MNDSVGKLDAFDHADLLAGLGGLQLLPENADRLIRLEYLAGLIAVHLLSDIGKTPVSMGEWDSLVNGRNSVAKVVAHLEDPFNCPFTEGFTFFDGTHTVLSGLAESGPFITRLVFQALFQTEPAPGSQEFQQWAR